MKTDIDHIVPQYVQGLIYHPLRILHARNRPLRRTSFEATLTVNSHGSHMTIDLVLEIFSFSKLGDYNYRCILIPDFRTVVPGYKPWASTAWQRDSTGNGT